MSKCADGWKRWLGQVFVRQPPLLVATGARKPRSVNSVAGTMPLMSVWGMSDWQPGATE